MPGHKSDYTTRYTMEFNADVTSAQKQIQQLQKSLDKIGTMTNIKGNPLTAELNKAVALSQELKITLSKSMNPDTNKLDLSKFNKNLKDSGRTLQDYQKALKMLGPEGQKAFLSLTTSIVSAEVPLRRTNKLLDSMWTTLKNTARWEISSAVLHGLEKGLSNAYRYAQELDKSLTDIRIVTGYTTDKMAEFAIEANKAAKTLTTTTNEYSKASLIYFQQGLNDQAVKERTDITIKMANVTRESAQTVSDQMTAVWNNFDDGSKSLEYYADVMTALGAATASSTSEISKGLEKFAAVADTVGLSYEYATAALATITSNTRQSADVVGTALKTLFARIQGLSLGETLEDGTDLTKYSEALNKVGISVKEQNGELKAMDDILDEMAAKWDTLNNDQQVALAQTVAGVRQYTQLVALMENWDGTDEDNMMANLRTVSDSSGALQRQQDVYAESWEAARDRVTAALEDIYNKILDSDFFIKLTNTFADFIDVISVTIDSLGGLKGILLSLAAIFTNIFGKKIAAGLNDIGYSFKMLTKAGRESETALRKQAIGSLSSYENTSTISGKQRAESYNVLARMQENYLLHENELSDLDKEINLILIERAKILAENSTKAGEHLEKITKETQIYENSLNKYNDLKGKGTTTDKTGNLKTTTFGQERERVKKLIQESTYNMNANNFFQGWNDESFTEEQKIESLRKKVDDLKRSFGLLDISSDELEGSLKNLFSEKYANILSELFNKLESGDPKIDSIKESTDKLDTEVTKFDNHVKEVTNNLLQFFLAMTPDDPEKAKAALEKLENQFNELAQSMVNAGNAQGSMFGILNQQELNFQKGLNQPLQGTEGLVSSFSSILSISSAITALTSSLKTLEDSSMSNSEKFFSLFTSLSMVGMQIPSIIKGFEGTVKIFGKVSMSMGKLTGIIGIVILTISALLMIFNEIKSSQPEEQLKKIREETQHLADTTNQANEACQNLKNTISSYSEAKKSLDTLTKGTEEFKTKLEEVNNDARELIKTLDLKYNQDYYIDSVTGEIVIKESEKKLTDAEYKAEESTEINQAAQYASLNQEKELENEIAYNKISQRIASEIREKNSYQRYQYTSALERGRIDSQQQRNNELIGSEVKEYLKQTIEAINENNTLLDTQDTKEIAKAIFDTTEINKQQEDYIKTIIESDNAFSDLRNTIKENNEAIKSNTKLLTQQILENEKTYQESDYKATIVTRSSELYNENYTKEKGSLDNASEADILDKLDVLGYDTSTYKKDDSGNYIFKDNFNNEVTLSLEEIKKLIAGKFAKDAVTEEAENVADYMISLAKSNPQLAAFIEQQSGGSKMSYNDQFELYSQIQKYGDYNNVKAAALNGDQLAGQLLKEWSSEFENLNPYADLEEKINTDFEGKEISTIIDGNELGEKDTKQLIKNWWKQLPEEDKTVALNVEFDKGQWEEQLNELKAESIYSETAEQTGYSKEAVESYTQSLMANNEAYKNNEYIASLAAQQALNFSKGITTATDVLDKYKDVLIEANENSIDYHTALGELNDALAQMFGTEFDYEYLKEHLSTIKDALDGDTEAIQTLRKEASKKILIDVGLDNDEADSIVDDLYNELSTLNIGDSITPNFIDAFNKLIEDAQLTREQVEDILGSMNIGDIEITDIEPEIKPKLNLGAGIGTASDSKSHLVVPIQYEETNPPVATTIEADNGQGMVTHSKGTMILTPDGGGEEITYQVSSDISTTTEGNSSFTIPSLSGGKILHTKQSLSDTAKNVISPKSSGGGGSSSKKEPLKAKDEIERYHENTRAIERLSRALDKVSKAKDRAFGKERLRLIDQEIASTQRLVAQQRAYIAEAKKYLQEDFSAIQKYGFSFDQYGELTNYDEVMMSQINKVNAAISSGNEEAIEAAEKEYEEFKENMNQYEETLNLYEEAQAQLQDYINQVVDLKLEKITTEVEVKIRVNDIELTKLEYLLKKIEFEGRGAAEAIGLIGKQFEQVNEKAKPIQEAIDKIYQQARSEGRGFTDEEIAEAQSLYRGGLTPEEERRLQEIHQKVIDEDRALTQAEEDQILEYKEQLLELNETVMEYVETVEGKFLETFDELNSAVDETIGRFATYAGMFETLENVITLTGKANTKYGKDLLSQFSARTVANASAAMRSNILNYNNLNKQYEDQKVRLAQAIQEGDERFIKTQQEWLDHIETTREAAYNSMLSSWNDVLQASSDLFDTKLDEMIYNLKQNLGDIDSLVEIYDRAVELENLYLTGNQSIYELGKLARDIGQSIDATSNLIAKNKLVDLLEDINKLRAEGVKLSQYDLEYWQAKYELELAEIALQEAQDAKSQVKLTRNSAGGWGYVYTADAEAVAKAEQGYEDALYKMQSLNDKYIADYSERILQNEKELVEALQNLDKNSAHYEEDIIRTRDFYFKQQEYLMNELNKVYERSGIGFKDTVLGQVSDQATLGEHYDNFVNSVSTMIENELIPEYNSWKNSVADANNEMGQSLEDFMNDISNTSDTLEDTIISKIDEMGVTVSEVADKIWDFQENYSKAIQQMIKTNEEFFDKTAKDYNNFISQTAIGEYLKNQEAFMSTGGVLGLTGKGGAGAAGIAGLGAAGMISSGVHGISSSSSSGGYGSFSGGRGKTTIHLDGTSHGYIGSDGTLTGGFVGGANGIWDTSFGEALIRASREIDFVTAGAKTYTYDDGSVGITQEEIKRITDKLNPGWQNNPEYYATGGYTGSWGANGRLAVLHEKELVLNKYDTENMLDMVNTLRDIDWQAKLAGLWGDIEKTIIEPALGGNGALDQNVHIEASFPNAVDHNEIEEAFNNLINTASQFANRKNY